MMSIQFKIWKRLVTNQAALSSRHVSRAMPLLLPLAIYTEPQPKFPNFCTETGGLSTVPLDRGVITDFFLNKCSLTEEDITRAFRHCNHFLQSKSAKNCEEVLELLNGCGLTTPAQIRRVILCEPHFFFRSERNIKAKLSFFRTFMKEEDMAKMLYRNASFITYSEDRLKSAVSLLRNLGLDVEAVSELLTMQPHFLTATEKNVIESFKHAEDLGLEKGSRAFAYALQATLFIGKEELDRRRLCLGSLGFSEKQILEFLRRHPTVLKFSVEKLKRNGDFLVNYVGIPLDVLVKYPNLFGYSLERNMIPRYRVMKELESMQVLKTKMRLPSLCSLSEGIFLEKYVHSNAKSSSVLLEIYHDGKIHH